MYLPSVCNHKLLSHGGGCGGWKVGTDEWLDNHCEMQRSANELVKKTIYSVWATETGTGADAWQHLVHVSLPNPSQGILEVDFFFLAAFLF